MTLIHIQLASGQWFEMDFFNQMANIGSEVFRSISWRQKNIEFSKKAFYRALELLDLTIADKKNSLRLKELLRLRETLIDYFLFENTYKSTDKQWQNYFFAFNVAARVNLGK